MGSLAHRFGHIRRYVTVQTALSMIATAQIEGGFTIVQGASWDRVSGAYMIEQAVGLVTDLTGDPWTLDADGMVASNSRAHDELLDAVAEVRERRGRINRPVSRRIGVR